MPISSNSIYPKANDLSEANLHLAVAWEHEHAGYRDHITPLAIGRIVAIEDHDAKGRETVECTLRDLAASDRVDPPHEGPVIIRTVDNYGVELYGVVEHRLAR